MKQLHNIGNLPKLLGSFMKGVFSGENEHADVFECTYDEMINRANVEKLEVQVIIDKTDTGRSYLCAIGATVRNGLLYESEVALKPIFYFAPLDEPRKRMFQESLREARAKILKKHREKLAQDAILKQEVRESGEVIRNEQARHS